MTQVALSPVFNDTQFSDDNGLPLAGGKIFTYEAGSNSVLQVTYTTIAGDVEQPNPIVLNASGRLPNEMWLVDGSAYNLVLTQADGTTVIQTVDNVRGSMPVPPGGGLGNVIWNPATVVPMYISATQFSLLGDHTINFAVGNRVRYQFDDFSYAYATITNVVYADPITQVTLELDSTGFNNTVINVAWSILVSTNMTVDAAGVSFSQVLGYAGNNIGTELQSLRTLIVSNATVWDTTNGSPDFVITPTVAATLYVGGKWSVHFTTSSTTSTLNISNVGAYPIKQYDNIGGVIEAVIVADMISEVVWDDVNTCFILLNQLPYTPPAPTPPTFAVTMGTVSPSSGTFNVVIGPSGVVHVAVACYAFAGFANFGEGTFTLYKSGTPLTTGTTRFFEWDSRTGGGNPTLLAAYTGTAGDTAVFTVIYAGPGGASTCHWTCITA